MISNWNTNDEVALKIWTLTTTYDGTYRSTYMDNSCNGPTAPASNALSVSSTAQQNIGANGDGTEKFYGTLFNVVCMNAAITATDQAALTADVGYVYDDGVSSAFKTNCIAFFAMYPIRRLADRNRGTTSALPIAIIRRSSDNSTGTLTSDNQMNYYVTSSGTTYTYSAWTSGSTSVYMQRWYDQSDATGSRYAQQTSTGYQPTIVSTGWSTKYPYSLYFTGGQYLAMNTDSVVTANAGGNITPVTGSCQPYTLSAKFAQAVSAANVITGCGTGSSLKCYKLNVDYWGANNRGDWYGSYINAKDWTPSDTINPVRSVGVTFDGTNVRGWINEIFCPASAPGTYTVASGSAQYIGNDAWNANFSGNMYSMFFFGSAIPDSDALFFQRSGTARPLDHVTTACRGAFSLSAANSTYANMANAIATVRRVSDSATASVYVDDNKQLYINTAGTTTLASCGSGTTVYLVTWVDQSGNGRTATQTTTTSQPTVISTGDSSNPYALNFNGTSAYLTIPDNTVPSGTAAAPYTAVTIAARGFTGASYFAGTTTSCNTLKSVPTSAAILGMDYYVHSWVTGTSNYILQYGYSPTFSGTYKFDGSTRYLYADNMLIGSAASSGIVTATGTQYIGKNSGYTYPLNGEIHNIYIFNTSIPVYDQYFLTASS